MVGMFGTASAGAIAFALLPAVQAHISLWHPSMFGFDTTTAQHPLRDLPFDQWWFHGNLDKPGTGAMEIPAGKTLIAETACSKYYTSYGEATDIDACPPDPGSLHAGGQTNVGHGFDGNEESKLMGCALAIAYKPDAKDVKPEDFTVMSVQPECVRWRETPFDIPANLPACPPEGCTCAWFWSGSTSWLEMYMTGFKCNVTGGAITDSYPKPVEPRKGKVGDGPTQPYYWGNNDGLNLDYVPDQQSKPSYNAAWGYTTGAQTKAFERLAAGSSNAGNSSTPVESTAVPADNAASSPANSDSPTSAAAWVGQDNASAPVSEPTSTVNDAGNAEPSSAAGNGNGDGDGGGGRTRTRHRPTWYNHAAAPTAADNAPAAPSASAGGDAIPEAGESAAASGCKRSRRRRSGGHF